MKTAYKWEMMQSTVEMQYRNYSEKREHFVMSSYDPVTKQARRDDMPDCLT